MNRRSFLKCMAAIVPACFLPKVVFSDPKEDPGSFEIGRLENVRFGLTPEQVDFYDSKLLDSVQPMTKFSDFVYSDWNIKGIAPTIKFRQYSQIRNWKCQRQL